MTKNYDGLAGIHFRTDIENANYNGYDNPLLVKELGKLGIGSIIIPGKDSYDFKEDVVNGHLVLPDRHNNDRLTVDRSERFPISKGGLEIVRARILTPRSLEEQVSVINGRRLREIGDSKWEQYGLVQDLDLMPKTILLQGDESLETDLLDNLHGEKVVIKGDLSQGSNYLRIVDKLEAAKEVDEMRKEFSASDRKNNKIIVQEYAPGLPWREIVAADDQSKEVIAQADTIELRMYCFVDRNKIVPKFERHRAIIRATDKNGDDEWASIDQESVPQKAWDIADQVSDRLLEKARVKGGYFAIDLIKTNLDDGSGDRILIREINTKDPMMVGSEEIETEAQIQRKALAKAMSIIAKS